MGGILSESSKDSSNKASIKELVLFVVAAHIINRNEILLVSSLGVVRHIVEHDENMREVVVHVVKGSLNLTIGHVMRRNMAYLVIKIMVVPL